MPDRRSAAMAVLIEIDEVIFTAGRAAWRQARRQATVESLYRGSIDIDQRYQQLLIADSGPVRPGIADLISDLNGDWVPVLALGDHHPEIERRRLNNSEIGYRIIDFYPREPGPQDLVLSTRGPASANRLVVGSEEDGWELSERVYSWLGIESQSGPERRDLARFAADLR